MHLETLMYMAVQQVRRTMAAGPGTACRRWRTALAGHMTASTATLRSRVTAVQRLVSSRSATLVRVQVKADFLAGPERPATPRGSQSAKEAASGGKAAACSTVSVPGGALAQPRPGIRRADIGRATCPAQQLWGRGAALLYQSWQGLKYWQHLLCRGRSAAGGVIGWQRWFRVGQ
jgi:hypothetical protein